MVLLCKDVPGRALAALAQRFAVSIEWVDVAQQIPGSYWGDSEAGLRGSTLLIRSDTPVHSVLHELCHFICMDPARRDALDTNAGGDYDEENAVCYLQILLADSIPGMTQSRMWQDMDSWGYTFRLGSAQAWFEQDAADANDWLLQAGLIDQCSQPTWQVRAATMAGRAQDAS